MLYFFTDWFFNAGSIAFAKKNAFYYCHTASKFFLIFVTKGITNILTTFTELMEHV